MPTARFALGVHREFILVQMNSWQWRHRRRFGDPHRGILRFADLGVLVPESLDTLVTRLDELLEDFGKAEVEHADDIAAVA